MKFAVIATSGAQHKVEEGTEILVDRLDRKEGDKILFDVILYVDDATVRIGMPTVDGSSVTATVIGHERGEKIRVAQYKAKSRQRRVRGFRHDYTRIKIDTIAS